jgi:superfamily II DNA/RNA helicase
MTKTNFENYNLDKSILQALGLLGYNQPTEVQDAIIPLMKDNKDIIVKSQTGSGKTAAFAIPICDMIDWEENKPQALVITPTRELALQVKEDVFNIGRMKRIKACAVFGKSPVATQKRELKQKMHVVVGTPGRLLQHIDEGTLDTSQIKYLVIDEADELLNMGFIEQVEDILKALPTNRVTALLSATFSQKLTHITTHYMKKPMTINIANKVSTFDTINQVQYGVSRDDKLQLLLDITVVENPDTCIIFCNTKVAVDRLTASLLRLRYPCKKIHGGMEQQDRTAVMSDFKQGKFRYLVATGVAARGIDIEDISLVVNYDVPEECEDYVHRIGRTGRKGRKGEAITFVENGQQRVLNNIEQYIGQEITQADPPTKERIGALQLAFDNKLKQKPKEKAAKDVKLSASILKLHINAGKKTKMRPSDIVGTLCSVDGITKDDIGVISVMDISTFVEVLNGKGEYVYEVLQNKPIKGRMRKISKANDEFRKGGNAFRY